MILKDAVDWFEGNFKCELGAPWRWADLLMTKPYQILTFDVDVASLHAPSDVEHRLVARMIAMGTRMKTDAGFRNDQRPKLFWRWKDKIRIEDGVITTRYYIDGNPGYTHGNPQKPSGRPTVGQMKMVA